MVPLAYMLLEDANVPIFNLTSGILLVALVILLILSSLFSSLETAYSTVNIIRLRNYMEEKRKGAKKAVYIAEKFDTTLTTLLIGNNLVNIGATTIATYIIGKLIFNPALVNVITTLGMTLIVLIFGEIIPKSYANENAEKVALRYSGVLFVIIKIFTPLSWFFQKLRKLFLKKNVDTTPQVTEEELESIIETMEGQGVIENKDAELMQNALDINDTNVYEIMTPRVDIVAIEDIMSIDEIKKTFFESQYSRIPVYHNDKDNIIGILHERDFFTAYINQNGKDINIRTLMSRPRYVSESTKVGDLIQDMQSGKFHFAIVSDEYGGTSGIVTLEDALEELVGEIYDEYDEETENSKLIKIDETRYNVNPNTELDYLFEELKLGKVPNTKYHNVGGFVYELSEETPYKGKSVTYHTVYEEESVENPVHKEYNLKFTIDKVYKRRILSLLLEIEEIINDEEKTSQTNEEVV